MYIKITYFPNGKYNGGIPSGKKEYKIALQHILGYDGHDFPFLYLDLSHSEVLGIISQIKQHRNMHLITMEKLNNGIKNFTIRTII